MYEEKGGTVADETGMGQPGGKPETGGTARIPGYGRGGRHPGTSGALGYWILPFGKSGQSG